MEMWAAEKQMKSEQNWDNFEQKTEQNHFFTTSYSLRLFSKVLCVLEEIANSEHNSIGALSPAKDSATMAPGIESVQRESKAFSILCIK